jgi:hypothetical protein
MPIGLFQLSLKVNVMAPFSINWQHLGRAALLLALLVLTACGGGGGNASASGGGPTRLAASATAASASTDEPQLVKVTNEKRVGRTLYDYTFLVFVKNGPVAQRDLTLTLIGAGPGTTIIAPTVHMGDMAPGEIDSSTDAVILRIDRSVPFDQAALVWRRGTEPAAQAIAWLEAAGKIPALDHGDALPGPDQNVNAIRDDIDTFIARQNFAAPLRAAAEQLARGLQAAVVLDAADPALAQPIAAQIHKGVGCVYSRFPKLRLSGEMTAHQLVRNLQKLTANTERRVRSYMKYNGSLNGSVATLPRGDVCEN